MMMEAEAMVVAEVAEVVSPLLARLDAEARAQLFGRREVRVRRPVVAANESLPGTRAAGRSVRQVPLVSMRAVGEKRG